MLTSNGALQFFTNTKNRYFSPQLCYCLINRSWSQAWTGTIWGHLPRVWGYGIPPSKPKGSRGPPTRKLLKNLSTWKLVFTLILHLQRRRNSAGFLYEYDFRLLLILLFIKIIVYLGYQNTCCRTFNNYKST